MLFWMEGEDASMIFFNRMMMNHFGIDDCLFGEQSGEIAEMGIADILNSGLGTIMGAMLSRGLFAMSITIVKDNK